MRKRIFEIIEVAEENDKASRVYDLAMIVIIIFSLLPLAFKTDTSLLITIDRITVTIFIIDYFLRWITADYKLSKGAKSFALYPFSVMAIIDLLTILPSLTIVSGGFKVLRVLRMIRAFRVFRVLKAFRYSKSIRIIASVLKSSKNSLIAVGTLALGYIIVSALVIFCVEPETFDSFFDAIYWATVSLTTVGYGDLYPVTTIGRTLAMISSLFGIAIVALPAGIITAGYMAEINNGGKTYENNETAETLDEDNNGSNKG